MKELKGVGYYIGLCSLKEEVIDRPIDVDDLEAIGFEDCEKTYVAGNDEDLKLLLPIKQADLKFNKDKVHLVVNFFPYKMIGKEEMRNVDVVLVFKVEDEQIENIAIMDSRGEKIHKKDRQAHIVDCELDRSLIDKQERK